MPLSGEESFPVGVQRFNRVQGPVLVRWKHRLGVGEVLYVSVVNRELHCKQEFYAKVIEGGRITMPKLVVELLEAEAGDVVYVTIHPAMSPSEEEV